MLRNHFSLGRTVCLPSKNYTLEVSVVDLELRNWPKFRQCPKKCTSEHPSIPRLRKCRTELLSPVAIVPQVEESSTHVPQERLSKEATTKGTLHTPVPSK